MRACGISGQVVDARGNPVTGALIDTEGATIHTITGGLFRLWQISAVGFDPQDSTTIVPAGADAPLTVVLWTGLAH